MSPDPDQRTASAALTEAADVGGYAPSIHNTQPWRWRVDNDTLELHAEPTRQLPASDPGGRLMVLSCGAALHHARVSLAAQGWQVDVDRLPDPELPRLLARLTVRGRAAVTPEAMRQLQTIRIRHTDRRPVTDTAVAGPDLDAIRASVEAERTWLHTLRPDDLWELASAASRAQELEDYDPDWRQEIAYWAGGTRPDGLGVPDSVIPHDAPQSLVPARDFGHPGQLPVNAGHDGAAVYGILFGREDTPPAWLSAGEALSAAWLTAIQHNLSLVPMSAAVEVLGTRAILRRVLSQLGEPFLVLRLGHADPDVAGPPHTPRLPSAQVVEVVGETS